MLTRAHACVQDAKAGVLNHVEVSPHGIRQGTRPHFLGHAWEPDECGLFQGDFEAGAPSRSSMPRLECHARTARINDRHVRRKPRKLPEPWT